MTIFAEAPLWSLGLMLFLAASVEYIAPPLPGDTLTLFGIFLVFRVGHPVDWTLVCITSGSVAGGLVVYGLGRWLGTHPRWQSWLTSKPELQAPVTRVIAAIERYGAWLILVNRFLPAMRAFIFLGAGIARVPIHRVVVCSLASALAWNALLLVAGYYLASEWDDLMGLVGTYNGIVLGVLALALCIGWAVSRYRRVE